MNEQVASLISFYINKEVFAFNTLKVRNILEKGQMTKVPNAKEYILGIINLHGNIIPVADLRMMMGVENIKNTQDTAIIVVTDDDKNDSLIGFVVDGVKEVFDVETSAIQESVFNGNSGLINSFSGLVMRGKDFVHIIDLTECVQEVEK